MATVIYTVRIPGVFSKITRFPISPGEASLLSRLFRSPVTLPGAAGPAHAAIRCLALDAAAAATCGALRGRGIDSVLLKGAGLGRRLGVPHQRLYNDVDLLVAPSTFDAAQVVLSELGYLPSMSGARSDDWTLSHERPWRIPGPVPLTIDLHRGFAGIAEPEAFWTAVSSAAERIELAGGVVAIPDEACTALLVALHAASPGRSAKPRADLARALDVLGHDAWRAAARIATRSRAASAFALGLRQVDRGVELAAVLGLRDRPSVAQWIVAHQGSSTAHAMARLAELPTTRARLRHLRLRSVPSAAAMRYSRALARRGPVGLVLAYLVRAIDHAKSTPGALRELRTAVRLARRSGDDGA
jgi:hypothetical protein